MLATISLTDEERAAVSTPTVVVLPAPFGPSRPRTLPSATVRSTPASAVVAPKRFTSPSTTIASVMPARYAPAPTVPTDYAEGATPCPGRGS
jgi:hypothetical protein